MRHAPGLRDASEKPSLVSSVIIANQRAPPLAQKCSGVLSRSGFTEIVDYRLQILKRAWRIGPEVSSVRFPSSRLEHGYRCLISMEHRVSEDFSFERIHQRLQLHTTNAHPLRQGRAWQLYTGASKNTFLAVQRQMVAVLGHQHLGQQARSGDAFVNDLRGHWRLDERFTFLAHPFAPNMLFNREHARCVVQLLWDILADAF